MRGSRFWSPQCEKRIDTGPKYTQEWRGGIRGIKTAIALEREKTAWMDKKGQTIQGSDDCAVAKGRDWRRENILPAPFLRPLWMLSAPDMARVVVRLIAIRKCPRTGRYPKACTCSTMDNLSSNDLQIFREKSRTFCGSVKIPLDKICHEELPNNPRQFNEKNVTTLLDFFRWEGCLRLDPEHYVPALISRSAVPRDLHPGGELPRLNPEHPVVCLHGRHRLEAARKFFTGDENRWWVVDLYSRGGRVDLP